MCALVTKERGEAASVHPPSLYINCVVIVDSQGTREDIDPRNRDQGTVQYINFNLQRECPNFFNIIIMQHESIPTCFGFYIITHAALELPNPLYSYMQHKSFLTCVHVNVHESERPDNCSGVGLQSR